MESKKDREGEPLPESISGDFGTIWELWELYRAGLRHEPAQCFELTPGTLNPVLKYFRPPRLSTPDLRPGSKVLSRLSTS